MRLQLMNDGIYQFCKPHNTQCDVREVICPLSISNMTPTSQADNNFKMYIMYVLSTMVLKMKRSGRVLVYRQYFCNLCVRIRGPDKT